MLSFDFDYDLLRSSLCLHWRRARMRRSAKLITGAIPVLALAYPAMHPGFRRVINQRVRPTSPSCPSLIILMLAGWHLPSNFHHNCIQT